MIEKNYCSEILVFYRGTNSVFLIEILKLWILFLKKKKALCMVVKSDIGKFVEVFEMYKTDYGVSWKTFPGDLIYGICSFYYFLTDFITVSCG